MTKLIVGGAGFVGQHLVDDLLSANLNERIVVVDKEQFHDTPLTKKATQLEFIKGDICHKDIQTKIFSLIGDEPSQVWHLAANSDILKSAFEIDLEYQLTLASTVALINASKLLNFSQIIFSSSSAVYGEYKGSVPYRETDMTHPISFYGVAKLASENFLKVFSARTAIPVYIFRFANIVGPRMTHGLLHDLYQNLQRGEESVRVLGDGRQRKTFLHVKDLIVGMKRILSKEQSGIFNLGPGDEGVTVLEIATKFRDTFSPRSPIILGSETRGWAGDVPLVLMNCDKAQEITGNFQSSNSAIEKTISAYCASHPFRNGS